jgi:hypothetical protein
VQDWIANKATLPQETQDYVKSITGRPMATWTVAESGMPALRLPQATPCQETAGLLAWNGPDQIPLPPEKPRTNNAAKASPAQKPLVAKGLRGIPVDQEVVAAP